MNKFFMKLGYRFFILSVFYCAVSFASGPAIAPKPVVIQTKQTIPQTQRTFIFNPRTLQWQAIQNGHVIRTGKASGGRHYCPDIKRRCRTPVGTFHIVSKGAAGCRSSRYPLGRGGAPMPYCMFFTKLYAIHGSYDVPHYNASHGCVRVTPADARWLSHHFIRIGTRVIVKPY